MWFMKHEFSRYKKSFDNIDFPSVYWITLGDETGSVIFEGTEQAVEKMRELVNNANVMREIIEVEENQDSLKKLFLHRGM